MTMTGGAAGIAAPPLLEEDEPPTWYVPLGVAFGGIFGLRYGAFAFAALLERGGARLRSSSASPSAACKCAAMSSSGIGVPSS